MSLPKPFVSYLVNKTLLPNAEIIKALDTNEFPFNHNSFYTYDPKFLAADEYNRCVEEYKDKNPNGTLKDLEHIMALMIVHEDGHAKELEQLAIKSIRFMYDIPEKIKIKGDIKWIPEIENTDRTKEIKKSKIVDSTELRFEIEKRRIINSIIHGGAIHQWTSAFYIIEESLNKINPELIPLYTQYSAMVNFYNWQHPYGVTNNKLFGQIQMSQSISMGVIQGTSKINYKKKQLEGAGLATPVLMHELSKAALEYIMSKGLPRHLGIDEMKYMLNKADKLSHEFWHYYMGPTLWRAILKTASVESQELPRILSAMSQMSYEELSMFCVKITFDANDTGIKAMNNLKRTLK